MRCDLFESTGGRIFYQTAGDGEKLLVFLHGFLGEPIFTKELFDNFGKKGFLIIVPFLPGHGKSFPLPRNFDFKDLVLIVEEFLASFGAKEIYMTGHSLGGAVSWQLGQKSGLPIKKIVPVSPALGMIEGHSLYYIKNGVKDLKFDFPNANYFKYCIKAIKAERQWQQIAFPWRMENLVRSIDVDFNDFRGGREVLALWGKNDLITPFEAYKEKLSGVKNMEVHFHEGGHHWFVPRKKEYFWELEKFL